jgi:hypothetical protein
MSGNRGREEQYDFHEDKGKRGFETDGSFPCPMYSSEKNSNLEEGDRV